MHNCCSPVPRDESCHNCSRLCRNGNHYNENSFRYDDTTAFELLKLINGMKNANAADNDSVAVNILIALNVIQALPTSVV